MSTSTTHLGLTKPLATEYPDISVLNNNFDLIDAACAAGENKVAVANGTNTAANATSVGQLTFKDSTSGTALWNGLDEVRLYNGTDALYCKEGVTTGLLMQDNQIKVVPVTWNAGVPAVGTVMGYINSNGDYHIKDTVSPSSVTGETSLASLRDSVNQKVDKSGDTITGDLILKNAVLDKTAAPADLTWGNQLNFYDKNDARFAGIRYYQSSYQNVCLRLCAETTDSNSNNVSNYIDIFANKDGSKAYSVSDPDNFRKTIGDYASKTLTTFSTAYISGGRIYFYKKNDCVFAVVEALAFKGHTGRQQIGTIPSGYYPIQSAYCHFNVTTDKYLIFDPSGKIMIDGTMAASTVYGSTTYILAS